MRHFVDLIFALYFQQQIVMIIKEFSFHIQLLFAWIRCYFLSGLCSHASSFGSRVKQETRIVLQNISPNLKQHFHSKNQQFHEKKGLDYIVQQKTDYKSLLLSQSTQRRFVSIIHRSVIKQEKNEISPPSVCLTLPSYCMRCLLLYKTTGSLFFFFNIPHSRNTSCSC